jgi:nitroreductase
MMKDGGTYMNSIFHRTSVRNFTERPVEQEKIEKILRAAMAAPSAGNQQPWEFYVVSDKDVLYQLSQSSPYAGCAKEAPIAIVACYRKEIKFPEYAQIDLSASVENIMLEADQLGLGTVWLGIAPLEERMNQVRHILNIPSNLEAFAIIPCGYTLKETIQQDRFQQNRIHYIS